MPDIAVHIARNKALAVKDFVRESFHGELAHKTILAADTIVVLENRVIGKPEDRDDAIQILQSAMRSVLAIGLPALICTAMIAQTIQLALASGPRVRCQELERDLRFSPKREKLS